MSDDLLPDFAPQPVQETVPELSPEAQAYFARLKEHARRKHEAETGELVFPDDEGQSRSVIRAAAQKLLDHPSSGVRAVASLLLGRDDGREA